MRVRLFGSTTSARTGLLAALGMSTRFADQQRRALEERLRELQEARDLSGAERACVTAISSLLGVSRAECLFFDSESGTLWSESAPLSESAPRERRAVAGLVAQAARTASSLDVPEVSDDPRWLPDVDGGQSGERLLALPVVEGSQVHAVLVAWRGTEHAPFTPAEEARLARFAARAAPVFDRLSRELEAVARTTEAAPAPGLFRSEALRSQRGHGSLLRVPGESTWAYLALAILLGGAGGWFCVARASCPASTDGTANGLE